ncbi:MAG: TlpA family protein disulfide reductase [Pirellula sp.]|nr:TlpA family protein disulfide reductase [Pirellula sp.]
MKRKFNYRNQFALKKILLAAVPLFGFVGCDSPETKEISAETSGYKPADVAKKDETTNLAVKESEPKNSLEPVAKVADATATKDAQPKPSLPIAPAPPEIQLGKTDAEAAKKEFMTLELPKTDDPAKLFEYIRENAQAVQSVMQEASKQNMTREAALKRVMSLGRDMVTASKLLAEKATTEEQKVAAALSKLQALAQMMGIGDVASADDLRVAALEEAASEIPEVAEQATGILLALSLNDFDKDAMSKDVLVTQVEKALKLKNIGQATLEAVSAAIQMIEKKTNEKEFALAQKLALAFRDNPEPRLAITAWNLAAQRSAGMKKLQELFQGKEIDDTKPLEEAIDALVVELDSPWTAAFLADITTQFEYSGKPEFAAKLVKKAEELAVGLKSEAAKEEIAESCAKFWKRASVLGSEIPWDGLGDLEGKPFQFEEYKGKIVILDIWATWCGPCIKELPNIKEVYAKHQAAGVEVIGVNIDENPEELKEFLAKEQLPWKMVVSNDPAKKGFETQLVQGLGITGIPFIAVIGRDGKVAALHTRGEALTKKIEELLAAPASN